MGAWTEQYWVNAGWSEASWVNAGESTSAPVVWGTGMAGIGRVPRSVSDDEIRQTVAGVIGATSGDGGISKVLSGAEVRSLISVYSTAQVDSAIAASVQSLETQLSSDIDAVSTQVDLVAASIPGVVTTQVNSRPDLVPPGGTTGQALIKLSPTDHDAAWGNPLAVGGGGEWEFSATAPGSSGKVWVVTPAFCGVHDVKQFINGAWRQVGWYSVTGVFSNKPPLNIVASGQSNSLSANAVGDSIWDNAAKPGILCWGTTRTNVDTLTSVTDKAELAAGTGTSAWRQCLIGQSPLFGVANNLGYQTANWAIKHGVADICRLIVVAWGGQSLDFWIDGPDGLHATQDQLDQTVNASGLDVCHWLVWHQGESGSPTGAAAGGYYTDILQYISDLRNNTTWFDVNISKFVAGGISTNPANSPLYYEADGAILALHYSTDPLVGGVPAWGLTKHDGTHFNGLSIDVFALRYFGEFMDLPKNMLNTYQLPAFDSNDTTKLWDPIRGQGGNTWYNMTGIQRWRQAGSTTAFFELHGTSGSVVILNPVMSGNFLRITQSRTPANASATGTTGDQCWDANFHYQCVATNTWKRTPISSW